MAVFLLWCAVLCAALATGVGFMGAFPAGRPYLRRGLWLVVLLCAVTMGVRGLGVPQAASGLAMGWSIPGVLALVLAAIAGVRSSAVGAGIFVPGLVVLSGMAGGVVAGFALAVAVLAQEGVDGVRGRAATGAGVFGALLLSGGSPEAAWCGAGCLSVGLLGFGRAEPMRGLLALAAMLAAWRIGPAPVWVVVFCAIAALPSVDGVAGDRPAVARLWVLLGMSALVPQAGLAWTLGAFGLVLQPRRLPGWLCACPPLLGGWSVWLGVHDVAALGHPGLRLGFGLALVLCLALEWHAGSRALEAGREREPWGVSLCLAAFGAVSPLLLRPFAALGGASSGSMLVLQGADGARVWPMLWWVCAVALGAFVWRKGIVVQEPSRVGGVDIGADVPLSLHGRLPADLLRGLASMRRAGRIGGAALRGLRVRLSAVPAPAPLLVWLGVLVAGWLWLGAQ